MAKHSKQGWVTSHVILLMRKESETEWGSCLTFRRIKKQLNKEYYSLTLNAQTYGKLMLSKLIKDLILAGSYGTVLKIMSDPEVNATSPFATAFASENMGEIPVQTMKKKLCLN